MVVNLTAQRPSSERQGNHLCRDERRGEQAEDVGAVTALQHCVAVEIGGVEVRLATHAKQMPGYQPVLAQQHVGHVAKHVAVNSWEKIRNPLTFELGENRRHWGSTGGRSNIRLGSLERPFNVWKAVHKRVVGNEERLHTTQ